MPTSTLERKFSLLWLAVHGPQLEREFRFLPPRRWRSDFCHHQSRTLIEIEGGAWGGRHTGGKGFLADMEKYFEATLNGFRVVRLSAPMLNIPTLTRLAAWLPTGAPQAHGDGSGE